jgi:hypothetical protein
MLCQAFATAQILASRCHNLTALDLSNNLCVSDDMLLYLAVGCPRLSTVNISYCANVTGMHPDS